MEKTPGAAFITEKYPDTADTKRPRKPVTERFERIAQNPRAAARLEKILLDRFTLDINDEELIQEIANDLYESHKRVAIEQGRGADLERANLDEAEILDQYKASILEKAEIQRRTLESWLNYLKETDDYPMWFKYYVVRSLRDMGQFSRDDTTYANRTEDTIAPFPELNSEALAFVKTAIEHQLEIDDFKPEVGELTLTEEETAEVIQTLQSPETVAKIIERDYTARGLTPTPEDLAKIEARLNDPKTIEHALKGAKRNKRKDFFTKSRQDFAEAKNEAFVADIPLNVERKAELTDDLLDRLKTKDFAKLYAFAQVECAGNLDRESIEGEWVKYDQGSDYTKLEAGLKGKGTGWCTAEGAAQNQLENGDFYVFYTKNKAGIPTEPRIAIRMEGDTIGEIRGVNQRQELEPELVDIAREKYNDLPGAERYEKANSDMKQMTAIYNRCFKVNTDVEEKMYVSPTLTKAELRFLYEMDSEIQGFGYDPDPRIEEVKRFRDWRQDIYVVFEEPSDDALARKMIEIGKVDDLSKNLNNLVGLTNETAKKLIEAGRTGAVAANLGRSFVGLTNETAKKLIEAGEAYDVAKNIEKFVGINHQDIAEKLIEAEGADAMAQNIEKFVGINHQDIAEKLIEAEGADAVAQNIEKFVGINHQEIVQRMFECRQADAVAYNLEILGKFVGINHQDIVEKLIEAGQAYDLARNLGKFVGINHQDIARRLIKAGYASSVAANLGEFMGLTNETAKKLIEAGQADGVAQNLGRSFVGLTNETAKKLIEAGRTGAVGYNIEKFVEIDHQDIAEKLIEAGDTDVVVRNLEKFVGLTNETAKKLIETKKAYDADKNLRRRRRG